MHRDAALARRELRRNEMSHFSGDLEWVTDPSSILAGVKDSGSYGPFLNTALWMIGAVGVWSWKKHNNTEVTKTLDKYGLQDDDRLTVAHSIMDMTLNAYGPGISFMSSFVELVPVVATREGVPREQWVRLANQTRELGKKISQD